MHSLSFTSGCVQGVKREVLQQSNQRAMLLHIMHERRAQAAALKMQVCAGQNLCFVFRADDVYDVNVRAASPGSTENADLCCLRCGALFF